MLRTIFRANIRAAQIPLTCAPVHSAFYYSTRPSFLSRIVTNIRNEFEKNREMKENVKKFREEAQKLEESDALKTAREKFNKMESKASQGGELLKEQLGSIKGRVSDILDEASKTELLKKAGQIGEDFTKSAKGVSQSISEKGKVIGQTGAFQTFSQATKVVRKEINEQTIKGGVYKSPAVLRKRTDASRSDVTKTFEENTDVSDIELHKDSRLYESWQNFKNNNQYMNKMLDWKMKYEESDNPLVRTSRLLTEKVSDITGNLFSKTELSETLTEICKIDPNFGVKKFLHDCETDIIPNILEALIQGKLDILKDWCFESVYNILANPIVQAQKAGFILDSKIIEIENIDLAMGKVMEQGPVLIITFQTQQIMCVRNMKNEVVEGDPDKVLRVNYVWVLCRDAQELNPAAAWRLMELSANVSEQFI